MFLKEYTNTQRFNNKKSKDFLEEKQEKGHIPLQSRKLTCFVNNTFFMLALFFFFFCLKFFFMIFVFCIVCCSFCLNSLYSILRICTCVCVLFVCMCVVCCLTDTVQCSSSYSSSSSSVVIVVKFCKKLVQDLKVCCIFLIIVQYSYISNLSYWCRCVQEYCFCFFWFRDNFQLLFIFFKQFFLVWISNKTFLFLVVTVLHNNFGGF